MITSIIQTRSGITTIMTVASDLVDPFFHWYRDGIYLGVGGASRTFVLSQDDQSRIDIIDTTDPDFDGPGNSPASYPARRTLNFVRSIDSTIASYRVEQQKNAGAWSAIATVFDDPKKWDYRVQTDRLDDLASYAWRVVPIDTYGNEGTATAIAAELVVRTPDAPRFAATFDQPNDQVLFEAA